jgi:hypothetical protein
MVLGRTVFAPSAQAQNRQQTINNNKQHRRNKMKFNKWTLGLAAVGVVSLTSAARADETKMSQVQTALSSTTISGYIDTTASWKFGNRTANMPGRTYDGATPGTYDQNGFNLNVVSVTLDKPLDEGSWSAGYHIQTLMGPGATKRGTGTVGGGATDFSFNEAYIALRVPVGNGIELHVGQFGTYNGYEAYDTYKDPNFSRSYGFFIESSAHTGVSGSYKINDSISLMAGIGNEAGFNNQVDANSTIASRLSYLSMVTLTAPESFGFLKGATLSGGYTVGQAGNPFGAIPVNYGSWNQGNLYAGASIPLPITGLSLGAAYDYTYGSFANGVKADKKSYANATALYLTYTQDKWTFANRADYGTGTSGTFAYFTPKGSHDELFSDTFTVGYAFWKNVITRAELRWDHTLSEGKPFGGTVTSNPATAAPDNKNAVSIALNVIYQF